jgi:trehalose transport system substrate-binding protein
MTMRNALDQQHETAKQLVSEYLDGGMNRRDMLKRAGALGISVPVLTAALGARGAVGQTPSASPAAEEAPLELGDWSGQTLRVSISLAESERTVFDEVVVTAFKDMTGGDIEVSQIEAQDVVNTLTAQVESGNIELDMVVQDNSTIAPLVEGGLVEELPEAEEVMPPATIEALKPVLQFDGKYYFLPARPNVQITFYNSAKFEEYGVEPPTTWEEVLSVGQTIQESAGVGQIGVQGAAGGPVGVTVTQFLWQAGGDPLEINNEAGQQAFQFMQDLKPYLTPQYGTGDFNTINTYLLNESVVLAQNWPFGVTVVVGDGGKTDVLTYAGWEGPAGNALVLGGDVFGVVMGTQNRDMALDFARVWMSREVQETLTARIGWASMRDDALGQVEDWQQPYFETVTEALTFTKARPSVGYWTDVENILTNAFTDIVTGGAEVASTLDRYQEEINALKG